MRHDGPCEVLDIVLDKLPNDRDVWACLMLSDCWAQSARATERLQIVITSRLTTCKQLVKAMSRRKERGTTQLGSSLLAYQPVFWVAAPS